MITLAPAVTNLIRQQWDDLLVVFQPTSAETHVFNQTTAAILACLESKREAGLSMKALVQSIEELLGLESGEIAQEDLAFAVARLEELGLIDQCDETALVDAGR